MSLTKNYLYNIIGLLTGSLFPFLIFPYISRVLMPESLGKVNFAQSLSSYFITLALLGIPSYGVRELSRARASEDIEEFNKRFTEFLTISIVTSIISFSIFMVLIMLNSKVQNIKTVLYIFSIQVFFAFLGLDYIFIVLEKHRRRTIRSVLLRIVSIIFIFTLVKNSSDYIIYGLILVVPETIARIIDMFTCKKYIHKKISELEFKKHFKPLLIIFLYVFSTSVYLNLDTTILGFLKSDEEVGLYITGSKLVKMLIPILSVLGTVMAPQIIGHIKNKEKDKVYEKMDKYIDFSVILGVPLMILMIFFSKDIILLISGDKFLGANYTMKIISVIILTIPLAAFFGGQILLPNDKENLVFKIAIIGMTINILFNFMLIPKYGIEGAAIATAVTETLIFFYRAYEVKKIYPDYKFITKNRLNYLLFGILSLVVIYLLKDLKNINYIYNMILLSIIYGIVYFAGLIVTKDKNIMFILKKIKI